MSLRIAHRTAHFGSFQSHTSPRLIQPRSRCRQLPHFRCHSSKPFIAGTYAQRIRPHTANISWSTIAAVSIAIGASIAFTAQVLRPREHPPQPPVQAATLLAHTHDTTMTSTLPAGRPGNLTPEQEIKLRELWALALRVFGVFDPESAATTPNGKSPPPSTLSRSNSEYGNGDPSRRKKGRLSLFRKKHKEGQGEGAADSSESSTLTSGSGSSTSGE
jgi:hypothetical protein